MLSRSFMLSVASLVVAGTFASNAHATNPKNYPGAFCLGVDSNAPGLSHTNKGSIENASTPVPTPISVLCPASKNPNTDVASGGYVRVRDQDNTKGGTHDVSCSFFSMFASGSDFEFFVNGPVTSNPPGTASPNWLNLSFGATPSASTDSYFYVCNIPQPASSTVRSGIATYQVNEN